MKTRIRTFRTAAAAAAMILGAAGRGEAGGSPLEAATHTRIEAALDALAATGDPETARPELTAAFDAAIAYAGPTDLDPVREAASAVRALSLLERSAVEGLAGHLSALRANPELASDLVFLARPTDDADAMLALLDRLRESRPEVLKQYPALCAAILVVYDEPWEVRRGRRKPAPEGQPRPPPPPAVDPLIVLDHFTSNARKMVFDPAKLPAELAVFMVGVEVSPTDMAWALDKYKGDAQIGRHYSDVPYDTMYLERGLEMKIDKADYTLPNLLRYGGVCADQAFFSESIGRACGVPAVIVSGTRGELSHAWAGYLQRQGPRTRWNFDEGRYDEFDDVRASADDPQTQQQVTTADLALLADSTKTPKADRQRAMALADAAARLAELAGAGPGAEGYPPPPPEGVTPGPGGARPATLGASLDLSRAAVNLCPSLRDAWSGVTGLAAAGRLDGTQRQAWADAVDQFCVQDYPDFAAECLSSIIAGIPDTADQARLWDWAVKRFAHRPDLAAEMLMEKAKMWREAGQKEQAYDAYLQVIEQFGNRTPLAPSALREAAKLLAGGREKEVLPLYAAAWKKIKRPSSAGVQFLAASNWYQIGSAYAKRLDAADQKPQAEQVRRQLDSARLNKK